MTSKKTIGAQLVALLSSYGLACVLLLCLFLLTLFGTLYQVEHGLFAAKQRFFSAWFLWSEPLGYRLPTFPAGLTCMSLLSLNMLVGGLLRLRITKRNVGVVIIHLGVALLLASGMVKQLTAEEGYLTLTEGQESGEFLSDHVWEVAIWNVDSPGDIEELVIRQNEFEDLDGGKLRSFTSPDLPFELRLSDFLPAASLRSSGSGPSTGLAIDGFSVRPVRRNKEPGADVASLQAEVRGAGDSQRALLWGRQLWPWTVEAGGKTWAIDLRHARYKMPFRIRLEHFEKEDHPGMSMAKAYRSDVIKTDANGEERVRIQMNEPLRDGGLVLFQSSFGDEGRGTYSTFSVVRNPSDKWPEYSLWVITIGLIMAFARKLVGFIGSQGRKRAQLATQGAATAAPHAENGGQS